MSQKFKLSDDQNTLTVDGVEYEAKLNDKKPHQSCKSCAFLSDGFFCKIAMETPMGLNASDVRHCEYPYRNDEKSIFWVKKEVEQMTEAPASASASASASAPAPHRHFDLIVEWAKDPTQQVWVWNSIGAQWVCVKGHEWLNDFYALGDRPTAPPTKKLKVKIELDRSEFEIEVPYDARPQEVDKAILDMATQFMVVTQEAI